MRFKFWPSTLRVQLILVVATAVAISNIGVAFYFYKTNEAQARNFNIDRLVDRAVAVAATASQVTPESRLVVMRFMSRPESRFREIRGGYDTKPMTAEETALAKRIADALPDHHPRKKAVIVHLHEVLANIPEDLRPFNATTAKPGTDVAQTIVPIDAHSVVSGVLVRPAAEVLARLGSERAWVVHGRDGLDELTVYDKTHVAELARGAVGEFEIDPADLGLAHTDRGPIAGGTPAENAVRIRAIFGGEPGAARDIVLLNTAAALVVAETARNVEEGIEMARKAIDSGGAAAKLEELAQFRA